VGRFSERDQIGMVDDEGGCAQLVVPMGLQGPSAFGQP
jgi:hypothetical protein